MAEGVVMTAGPSAADSRRMTSREVAARAGVSQATVSNVLNRPHLVAEVTRERVRAVIEEHGFAVHDGARRLRAGRSTTVAVSVLDTGNPFWGELMRGVSDVAADHAFVAMVGSSNESEEKEVQFLHAIREQRVAAVLAAPVDPSLDLLRQIDAEGSPVVLLDYRDPSASLPFVRVDDVSGAAAATSHLLELGHERIAMINGPHAIQWCADRWRGALEAVSEAGLDPAVALTEVPVRRLIASEGERAMTTLLDAARREVTAVVCANDLLALGALRAAHHCGVAVPRDLSLVGYDDVDFAAMLSPALTTVRQQPYLLGRAAMAIALGRLKDPDGSRDQVHPVFVPEFVPRESTAPRV